MPGFTDLDSSSNGGFETPPGGLLAAMGVLISATGDDVSSGAGACTGGPDAAGTSMTLSSPSSVARPAYTAPSTNRFAKFGIVTMYLCVHCNLPEFCAGNSIALKGVVHNGKIFGVRKARFQSGRRSSGGAESISLARGIAPIVPLSLTNKPNFFSAAARTWPSGPSLPQRVNLIILETRVMSFVSV